MPSSVHAGRGRMAMSSGAGGVKFGRAVAAYAVVAGLSDTPLRGLGISELDARVSAVTLETDAVDDLRINFATGWTAYIQVKRTLRGGAVLEKAVTQWMRASEGVLDPSRHRLVIAVGELTDSTKALRRALDARRLSVPGTPSPQEAEQLRRIEALLSPLDPAARDTVLQCAVIWHLDVEETDRADTQNGLHLLRGLVAAGDAATASNAWSALLDAAGHAARRSGGHDLEGWRTAILDRGIGLIAHNITPEQTGSQSSLPRPSSDSTGSGDVQSLAGSWDFFVSYTKADGAWAEWIAWQLEAAGFRVLIQAWDFVPGAHWLARMAEGVQGSHRVLAVLSHAYLTSVYGRAEWQNAFRADPDGQFRKVIPIRVEDCLRPALLDAVVSFDLFGLDATQARTHLLDKIKAALDGRAKPTVEPLFPGPVTPPTTVPRTGADPTPAFPPTSPRPRRPVVDWSHPIFAHALTGPTDEVSSVAFSPDGRILVAHTYGAQEGAVWVWDVTSPTAPTPQGTPFLGPTGIEGAVGFTPDGHILVADSGSDDEVRLWDVTSPAAPRPLCRPLTSPTSTIGSVAFSPDGRTLAVGTCDSDQGQLWMWDVTSPAAPKPLGRPLTGPPDTVVLAAFSPDGRTLAAVDLGFVDGAVWMWDMTNPLSSSTLTLPPGVAGVVGSVAFSPDGRALAVGTYGRNVKVRAWIWDVTNPATPQPLATTPTGSTDAAWSAWSVAFSPDGRTLAGGDGRAVCLWDVKNPATPKPLETRHGRAAPTDAVGAVGFSPDGRTLAASIGREVWLWSSG